MAGNVSGFGKSIPNGNGKQYDLLLTTSSPKFVELKSRKFLYEAIQKLDTELDEALLLLKYPIATNGQFVGQFIDGYIAAINNFAELRYVFEARKLTSIPSGNYYLNVAPNRGYHFPKPNSAADVVKNQFYALYKEKFDNLWNIMKANTSLKTNLNLSSDDATAQIQLRALIENYNSNLYSFIHVE